MVRWPTRIIEPKRLDQARRLRRNQTPAENPIVVGPAGAAPAEIGPFTVDFLCREARLIIEVDGATHSEDRDIEYDQRRTVYLESEGYRILRILNDDIYHRFNDVMDMILLALAEKLPED